MRAGENTTCPEQGILRGDEKAKTRRQLVVGISRWSASLPEMEQQLQTKRPSWREEDRRTGPSAGVLGQAGERSLSPSARKWNKGKIKALSSFHLSEGQEAKRWMETAENWKCFMSRSRKEPGALQPLRTVFPERWEWKSINRDQSEPPNRGDLGETMSKGLNSHGALC